LPFGQVRVRPTVVIHTSSGIQITDDNDLTNRSEFGDVHVESVEMCLCIQIAILIVEVG
jgi:hypothetical protein